MTRPSSNRGSSKLREQAERPRSRSQERQGWNTHPALSCSEIGTWLNFHTTLTGLRGRQRPGAESGHGGTLDSGWGQGKV